MSEHEHNWKIDYSMPTFDTHPVHPEPHRLDECLRRWKELREKGDVR